MVFASFSKEVLQAYKKLLEDDALSFLPWLLEGVSTITERPNTALVLFDDPDNIFKNTAFVMSLLEYIKVNNGASLCQMYVTRPDLIAYWNRICKTDTDQCPGTSLKCEYRTLTSLPNHASFSGMFSCIGLNTHLIFKLLYDIKTASTESIDSLDASRALGERKMGSFRPLVAQMASSYFEASGYGENPAGCLGEGNTRPA